MAAFTLTNPEAKDYINDLGGALFDYKETVDILLLLSDQMSSRAGLEFIAALIDRARILYEILEDNNYGEMPTISVDLRKN